MSVDIVLMIGAMRSRFLVEVSTVGCEIVTSAVLENGRSRDGFRPCDGNLLRFHG
jgi:hypothetical protein